MDPGPPWDRTGRGSPGAHLVHREALGRPADHDPVYHPGYMMIVSFQPTSLFSGGVGPPAVGTERKVARRWRLPRWACCSRWEDPSRAGIRRPGRRLPRPRCRPPRRMLAGRSPGIGYVDMDGMRILGDVADLPHLGGSFLRVLGRVDAFAVRDRSRNGHRRVGTLAIPCQRELLSNTSMGPPSPSISLKTSCRFLSAGLPLTAGLSFTMGAARS